jgi:protein-tyrosine phosphatase
MAEALMRKKLDQEGLVAGWRVESAGTWASAGHPALDFSDSVMRARGLDISQHRSKGVEGGYLEKFDLILTMEKNHKEALQVEFPQLSDRIYMLSEVAGQKHDVEDPIGGPEAEFEATADEIERLIDAGFEKIKRLAGT